MGIEIKKVATEELVALARSQTIAGNLDDTVLRELQMRYSRESSPEERALISDLDRTVFIPQFGYTKLPPGVRRLSGAKKGLRNATATTPSTNAAMKAEPNDSKPLENSKTGPTQFPDAIKEALRELLESKHLFQSVRVNIEKLLKSVPEAKAISEETPELVRLIIESLRELPRRDAECANLLAKLSFDKPWKLEDSCATGLLDGTWNISPPRISIQCPNCDSPTQPYHPKIKETKVSAQVYEQNADGEQRVQILALPYQCQNCLKEPVIFFVRRQELKLTLVGRSQFGAVYVPDYIPKNVRDFYREAIVGFKTGRLLGAIFYLRTCIEQHMRAVVKPAGRIPGEELADQYKRQLPTDFPPRLSSFKKTYEDLSAAMHEAREDEALFKTATEKIEKHFDALRLLTK